jgi:hypothetical protein
MKQKNLRRTLAAAILTLVAGAAYGQDLETSAKIPFAFRAFGSDLPAGTYAVGPLTGNPDSLLLRNLDTGKSVFMHAKAHATEATNESRARLVFRCGGEEGCSLAQLWAGTGTGFEFATPKLTADQRERRETIYLDRFKDK